MKKFIVGIIVALLVCTMGIFAGLNYCNDDKKPVNEKDPVFCLPDGGVAVG